MNALYNIAIIEGFLTQHSAELPAKVQAAIDYLKQANNADGSKPVKKKKKMSAETRAKLLAALAKGRAARDANVKARQAAK